MVTNMLKMTLQPVRTERRHRLHRHYHPRPRHWGSGHLLSSDINQLVWCLIPFEAELMAIPHVSEPVQVLIYSGQKQAMNDIYNLLATHVQKQAIFKKFKKSVR